MSTSCIPFPISFSFNRLHDIGLMCSLRIRMNLMNLLVESPQEIMDHLDEMRKRSG